MDEVSPEAEEKSGLIDFIRDLKPWQLIMLIVLPMIAYGFYASGKFDYRILWATCIVELIIIIWLLANKGAGLKLLPEWKIKEIAYNTLVKKRKAGIEIPFDAKVKVNLSGRGKYESDILTGSSGIVSWHVGFQVNHWGLVKTGVIEIHPYTGAITGFRYPLPLGYTGNETRDIKIVPAHYIEENDQGKDFGNGKGR